MEGMKLRKEAKQRHATLVRSKSFALAVLRRFQKSRFLNAEDLIIPDLRESSLLIQNIIRSPITVQIDDSSLANQAEDLLNGLFDEWRNTVQDHLLNQLTSSRLFSSGDNNCRWKTSESTAEEGLRRLSLATTVFTCECSQTNIKHNSGEREIALEITLSRPSATIKPLFYPQVLGHICLDRTPKLDVALESNSPLVLAAFRASQGYPGPQGWDCSSLRLNTSLGEMVERLVRTARLDPETATVQDMDELGIYFACMSCAVQDEDEIDIYDTEAFQWREAVRFSFSLSFTHLNYAILP
jgi:hypothetical protein